MTDPCRRCKVRRKLCCGTGVKHGLASMVQQALPAGLAHLWRRVCVTACTGGMASRCPQPSRAAPHTSRWRSRWGMQRRSCSTRPHLGTRHSPAGTCGHPAHMCAVRSFPPPSTAWAGSCSRQGRPRLGSSRRPGTGTRHSLRAAAGRWAVVSEQQDSVDGQSVVSTGRATGAGETGDVCDAPDADDYRSRFLSMQQWWLTASASS
jgi:hypothetical protein